MTQYTEPLGIAGLSALGLVAQITAPIPDDLKSWPVTAILGLLLLSMLGVVSWMSYMSNKASIANSSAAVEQARALQSLTDHQQQNNSAIMALTAELRINTNASNELVTTMRNRPCIAPR